MSNYGNDWRDTDFGEGQERYYGDLTQHQPGEAARAVERVEPAGSGGGGGKGPLVAVAGVLAVALAAGGVYVATRGDGEVDPQTQSSPAASSSAEPAPTARVSPKSDVAAGQKPQVDGWRVNGGNGEFPVVFDVPPASETFKAANGSTEPEWSIVTDDSQGYGFAHPRTKMPLASTQFAATYRIGHCSTSPTNALAFVGFIESSGDAPAAASTISDKFLKAMSLKENGTDRVKYSEGEAKTIKLDDGKTSAVQIRTDVPWSRSDNSYCSRHERELVVTSVPTSKGTGTVVSSRVKDPSQGVDKKVLDKVLGTVRPRV